MAFLKASSACAIFILAHQQDSQMTVEASVGLQRNCPSKRFFRLIALVLTDQGDRIKE